MKNKLTTIRLIKFARHIGSRCLKDKLLKKQQQYFAEAKGTEIKFLNWAIRDLPTIFPKHWAFSGDGSVYLKTHPQSHPLVGAGIFFKLTMQEIAHLFIPGKQNLFLGRELKINATPEILIDNLYELVLLKENKPSDTADASYLGHQNKIIKIKYQPSKFTNYAA